jgi:hypothetical protein
MNIKDLQGFNQLKNLYSYMINFFPKKIFYYAFKLRMSQYGTRSNSTLYDIYIFQKVKSEIILV